MTMPNDSNAVSPTGPVGRETGDESSTRGTAGARAQIREVKDQVVDQAKNSFRQAKDSAGSSLGQSRNQAADRIGGIANAFRSTGNHLRSENQAGVANLTDSLADQVERLSSYLRDRDMNAFRNDLESFARRQPAVAVGVALALGVLGARFIKSSQRSGDGYVNDSDDTGYGRSGGYGMSSQPAGGGYGGA